jgi:hypothetical protein
MVHGEWFMVHGSGFTVHGYLWFRVKGCVRGAHASLWFRDGQSPESTGLGSYGDNLNDK